MRSLSVGLMVFLVCFSSVVFAQRERHGVSPLDFHGTSTPSFKADKDGASSVSQRRMRPTPSFASWEDLAALLTSPKIPQKRHGSLFDCGTSPVDCGTSNPSFTQFRDGCSSSPVRDCPVSPTSPDKSRARGFVVIACQTLQELNFKN